MKGVREVVEGVFVPVRPILSYIASSEYLVGLKELYVECRKSGCGQDFVMHVDLGPGGVATVLKGDVRFYLENSRGARFAYMASEIWCLLRSGSAVRVKSRSLGPGEMSSSSWKPVEELVLERVASTGSEPRRYAVR